MKKHIMLLMAATVATIGHGYAQYSGDALRFSQTNYGSSARFKGMGNAQIGVGGDISSLGGNPAGLGLFTKSEFVFTPEFNGTSLNTNFLNNQTNSSKSQINLNQIGAAFYMPATKSSGDTQKGLISAVIGLGYNRNNDYGLQASYSGINTKNSVYNAFNDYSVPPNSKQVASVNREGGVSEFNIAGALNISNQFYIGATLGLINLKLNNDAMLDEDGLGGTNYYINYNQNQTTKGSGINAKFGFIFRPIPSLRLGANLQTPTWFNIEENFNESSNDRNLATDGESNFSYNLRTPLKGSLGGSYIIGKRALISADVDFVDYASIRFSSSDGGNNNTIANNNTDVRRDFKSAVNYRVGGEVKLTDELSLRGGYGMNGTAYKDDDKDDFATKFYTGGLGYRTGGYYIDLAYQRVETRSTFSPYLLKDYSEPVATSKNSKNNVFLTVGLRF